MVKCLTTQQPKGAVHFAGDMSSNGYFLHRIEHSVVISTSFGVSISQVGIVVPNNSIKVMVISFS